MSALAVDTSRLFLMTRNFIAIAMLPLALVVTAACEQRDPVSPTESQVSEQPAPEMALLEAIKKRGKLIVLTANLPTTYYFDRDNQPSGPEYDMTQSFAKSIQVDVEYKIYDSTKELLAALRNKEGDIAAAGLTVNDTRKAVFDFGPVYQTTNEYLVCHRDKRRIKDEEDLKNSRSFSLQIPAISTR